MSFFSKEAAASLSGNSSKASSDDYFKTSAIENKGQARIRIISKKALHFWQVWGESPDGKKSFRFRDEPTPEQIEMELGEYRAECRRDKEGNPIPGAYKVGTPIVAAIYNYEESKIQIWQVDSVNIRRELFSISQQEDYNKDITSVDLVIRKEIGSNGYPSYSILPVPIKKGTEEAVDAAWIEAQENGFDLDRHLDGGNPFANN